MTGGNVLKKTKTTEMILCAMFVALIAVGAFITIPIPMLPITMQNMFTMLAGLLLGGKIGGLSVCIYILLGLIGLPIFTQGGGIGYVFQPSFGYLIGFAAGAFVTGTIAHKKSNPGYRRILGANFAGLAVIYTVGMAYYYVIRNFYLGNPIGLQALFIFCFLATIPGDIVKCIVGAFLGKRLIPLIKKGRV